MAKGRRSKNNSKGLGDTIAKATKATGVDKLVKSVFGDDCGCDKRQEKLNKLVPYKTNCLTEEEYNYLNTNFGYDPKTKQLLKPLHSKIKFEVEKIYNRIFNLRGWKFGTCPSCASKNHEALNHINDVLTEYRNELK